MFFKNSWPNPALRRLLATVMYPSLGFCSAVFLSDPVHAQQELTLPEAIQRALDHSPMLESAKADLQGQVERTRSSWSSLGPRVDLQWRDVRFEDKQEMLLGPNAITLRDDRVSTGSAVLTQPILGLYGLYEKAQFEDVNTYAKNLAMQMTRREIVLQTAETYLRAHAANMLLDVALASQQAADAQVRDGQELMRVGRINRGDYLRLQVAASEAQARAAEAEAYREILFATLRELIGEPDIAASRQLAGDKPLAHLGEATPIPSHEDILRAAMEANPEYLLAKTGHELATFSKKLAYTEFLPSLNFFAQFDKDFQPLPGNPETTRSFGLALNWNIWSSGASAFRWRESSQQIASAASSVKSAEQRLRLVVYQHLANLRAQELGIKLASTTVEQATEAYRIAKAKFSSGSSTASDLVLAEASLTAARGREITSHTDYKITRLHLQKAMGRDIQLLIQP
jgi:outer membrane protein